MRGEKRFPFAVAALGAFIVASAVGACDDDHEGANHSDASAGARHGEDSGTGGKRATGGTSVAGNAGKGGTTNTGGTGGAGGRQGANGGSTDASADGSGGSSGGVRGSADASADASGVPDAGTADAGDGSRIPNTPLCETDGGPFFVGTYTIHALVATTSQPNAPDADLVNRCSLDSSTLTLKIFEDDFFTGFYDVELDGVEPVPGDPRIFTYVDIIDTSSDVTHIHGECPGCQPPEKIDVDLDERTGIVKRLDWSYSHGITYFEDDVVTGTGWPVCAATTASPPTWVPAPPTPYYPDFVCGSLDVGCTRVQSFISHTGDPVSTCASLTYCPCEVPGSTQCPCVDGPDGYQVTCCGR